MIPIAIDKTATTPLYRQLYDHLKLMIEDGMLEPGAPLPPTRELANSLQVSRVTVTRTYQQLLSQGYLSATVGSGTFVSRDVTTARGQGPEFASDDPPEILSRQGQWLLDCDSLNGHLIAPVVIPPPHPVIQRQWRQIMLRHCRTESRTPALEPFGHRPLRQAIAEYLKRTRAVNCSADQVIVFANAQQTLSLIGKILIDPGDMIAVENPGNPAIREVLLAQRACLWPLSVDQEGANIQELFAAPDQIKAVYLTPSQHDPTGAALSQERRMQLLRWAQEKNGVIIEDDSAHQYRYTGGSPLRSIHGINQGNTVFYISSFWQTLLPLSSISFMVVPHNYIDLCRRARTLMDSPSASVEQYILTDFLNDGHLERHARSIRQCYAKHRQALIFAISRCFLSKAKVARDSAALHVMVKISTPLPDEDVIELAAANGVRLISCSHFYMRDQVTGVFIVPFADINPLNIFGHVLQFAEAVRDREALI